MFEVMATEYTKPYSKEAVRLRFKYLPESVELGPARAIKAKEKWQMHPVLLEWLSPNAFLGINPTPLAHKLGGKFHIPHGIK